MHTCLMEKGNVYDILNSFNQMFVPFAYRPMSYTDVTHGSVLHVRDVGYPDVRVIHV